MDAIGKLLGLGKVGQLAFHPDGVGKGPVGDGAVDGAFAAASEAVVALAGAERVPVEEDVAAAEQVAGEGASLGVGEAGGAAAVVGLEALLVGARQVGGVVDGGGDGIVEAHEARGSQPVALDALQVGARLAGLLGLRHELVERGEGAVGGAEDEGVVARVDVGGDEGGGLGVGAGDGDEVGAWRRGLSTAMSPPEHERGEKREGERVRVRG